MMHNEDDVDCGQHCYENDVVIELDLAVVLKWNVGGAGDWFTFPSASLK